MALKDWSVPRDGGPAGPSSASRVRLVRLRSKNARTHLKIGGPHAVRRGAGVLAVGHDSDGRQSLLSLARPREGTARSAIAGSKSAIAGSKSAIAGSKSAIAGS